MKKDENSYLHKRAYALKYKENDVAPKVIAGGKGYLAQKILERAKENKIATYYNPELVGELEKIDIGSNIPPELYEVVASILVFISNLDSKLQ